MRVDSDGTLRNGPRPWGYKRVVDTFWFFVDSVVMFFQTLVPFSPSAAIGSSRDRSRSSFSGNSRPSNGRRPLTGGFRTMSDIRPPPPAFGCAGGACGR